MMVENLRDHRGPIDTFSVAIKPETVKKRQKSCFKKIILKILITLFFAWLITATITIALKKSKKL